MYLKTLYLRDFRCYSEAAFEFCRGINIIHGDNARGKTSLLEAIYVLIAGHSFRAQQLSDLQRIGSTAFYLEATFVKHGIEQTLKFAYDGQNRRMMHNSTTFTSTASLLGLLHGVVIAPDDASLVKGAPTCRRRFLDLQIAQVDPLYVHHSTRYHRAMRQRNTLLRAKTAATLDSWEAEMAHSATYLVQHRRQTIQDLEQRSRKLHTVLSGEPMPLILSYKSGAPEAQDNETVRRYYQTQLQRLRPREMLLGNTLTGPHKDDLHIAIGEQEARFFASEGQQRSCVAALRLAEWERLHLLAQEKPLMLLDDIGVSLDGSRRSRLMNYLPQLGQVFITSTEEEQGMSDLGENRIIKLK